MNTRTSQDADPLPDLLSPLARDWWVVLLYGVIAIVFGLVALFSPVGTAVALAWAIGVMALAEGIVSIVALFSKDPPMSKGLLLVYAVASISFGLWTVFSPGITAIALLLLIGAWLIVGGIFRIVFAIRARKEIEGEWLLALGGVLGIVLGVLFALDPLGGLFVTTLWIGAGALVYGVVQIVAAFKLRKHRVAA
ncbi:HdeD family acid-resistance protein [Luteimonas sp. BDR2-5]|uniref:HdeD family acid-resistance protein n=1 Tax=Proluteimonas luteida TaxID=2878685 RepID=UPI001E53A1E1|nr:HdeD family acid-resistance protein [Luteimonas sp. BDR2-5]MCD9028709.1 HdeD family acid-resistance protein [Luteimonas sp. BDR2-5]